MVYETLPRPRWPKIKAIKAGGTNTGPRRGRGGSAEAFLSQLSFPAAVPPLSQRPAVPLCSERGGGQVAEASKVGEIFTSQAATNFCVTPGRARTLEVQNLTGGRPHEVLTMAGSRFDIARQMKLWNYLKHATECSFQAQSGQHQGLGWPAYPIWQQVCAHRCSGQGLNQWHSPCLSYHGW